MADASGATKIPPFMRKIFIGLAVAASALAAWFLATRVPDDWEKLSGPDRITRARKARGSLIRERCQLAGVSYPPREIFLRAFKHEAELELWARGDEGAFRRIATFPILASSGSPGPKRREGDRQVPEGFYVIDRFNAESAYHLSLGLNYPNADDLRHADPEHPGGDIFIHGKDVTIGCLPIGDAAIEELFLIALDVHDHGQREIPVHVFPARMSGVEWAKFSREQIARDPAGADFWERLRPRYEAFERDHRSLGKSPRASD